MDYLETVSGNAFGRVTIARMLSSPTTLMLASLVALPACVAGEISNTSSDESNLRADAGRGVEVDTDGASSPDATPNDGDPGVQLGTFQMTYYWLALESDFEGSKTEALYDVDCEVVASVSPSYASALRLEGSGRLNDGRVLNYYGGCSCPNSPCFFELGPEAPWGYGVQNYSLHLFRSIAVDSDEISIGSGIYVEELDGLTMPEAGGGYIHDGCVTAHDMGGGINGAHIDFFTGLRSYYTELNAAIGTNSVTIHRGGERCPDT